MFVEHTIMSIQNIEKLVKLPKLDSTLFTWLNWKAGSIHDLGLKCRYEEITSAVGKLILKTVAIGWCFGENLPCRPKAGEIGLMCHKNGEDFWFHIRIGEFLQVFTDKNPVCMRNGLSF